MITRSPTATSGFSLWARNLFVRLMYFWYISWRTRFSTATTTVFCILFETTTPTFSRLLSFCAFCSSIGAFLRGALTLIEKRFDLRDLAADLAHLHRDFHLAGGALEAELEQLLAQVALAVAQLELALVAQAFESLRAGHYSPTSVCDRVTKRVLIGSLCAARRNASSAISRVTPSIS